MVLRIAKYSENTNGKNINSDEFNYQSRKIRVNWSQEK